MSNLMLEEALSAVEVRHAIDLGRGLEERRSDHAYYPQFEAVIREEAAAMAEHYAIFYCLEKSIRQLISGKLKETEGPGWWQNKVPQSVKDSAKKNIDRERDAGITARSEHEIDYITFGELADIITSNWGVFADTFSSRAAVTRVFSSLNLLRSPIAHCSLLAPDEIDRLRLTMRDWFRLME